MTQTTDTSTEDTTMTDSYGTYHNASNDTNASTATKSLIKIAFKMKKGESTNISEKHRDILVAMSDADNHANYL